MSQLKKLVEKKITKEDVEKIKWLYSGIDAIDEKGKKIALEKHLKGKDKYISSEEFRELLASKKVSVPETYQKESERYQKLLIDSIYEMVPLRDIKDSKLGKRIGIPDAKEHLFELTKKGKPVGFVHINKTNKKINFVEDEAKLPKKFRKALEEK